MDKNTISRVWRLGLILMLLSVMIGGLPVNASVQSQEQTEVASEIAFAEAPTLEEPVLYSSPPALTEEQVARMEWAVANTHGSPKMDTTVVGEVASPAPGTESFAADLGYSPNAILAPNDPISYTLTEFGSAIPADYKSNVMESSTAGKGVEMFYTGNWFAANSVDKGHNWTFLSPYADYPSFCCDQVTLYDETRDIYLWLRMGVPDGSGVNTFKLSVDANDPFTTSYWTYTFAPTGTNAAWTNQWWDYPHMQLGADYLYISWNMFDNFDQWVRTVMLRFPLDSLAIGAGFGYQYLATSDWFTFVPVSGAHHTMYFASNTDMSAPYDSLRIYRWHEDSNSLFFWTKAVPAWTPTDRGSMHCGTPNWLDRGDQRLLTGARYEINNDGIAEPRQTGRKVLGWWWNVAEGGGFDYPYIDGAAFYEDTMELLPGYLGRPYMWGGWCFAYPSFTPNDRGDLGGVFHYSMPPNLQRPVVGFTIADDFYHAPPGWPIYLAKGSNAGPSDEDWGDYNTARTYQSGNTWIAGSHRIPSGTNCTRCSVPLWMGFGRERDAANFRYSCQIWGTCIPLTLRP